MTYNLLLLSGEYDDLKSHWKGFGKDITSYYQECQQSLASLNENILRIDDVFSAFFFFALVYKKRALR